jgi:hypothetical protein
MFFCAALAPQAIFKMVNQVRHDLFTPPFSGSAAQSMPKHHVSKLALPLAQVRRPRSISNKLVDTTVSENPRQTADARAAMNGGYRYGTYRSARQQIRAYVKAAHDFFGSPNACKAVISCW